MLTLHFSGKYFGIVSSPWYSGKCFPAYFHQSLKSCLVCRIHYRVCDIGCSRAECQEVGEIMEERPRSYLSLVQSFKRSNAPASWFLEKEPSIPMLSARLGQSAEGQAGRGQGDRGSIPCTASRTTLAPSPLTVWVSRASSGTWPERGALPPLYRSLSGVIAWADAVGMVIVDREILRLPCIERQVFLRLIP